MADWALSDRQTSRSLVRASQSFSSNISVLVTLLGVVVLLGWIFQIDLFKSVLPNSVAMKVNTALGFICSGTALRLWHQPSIGRWTQLGAQGCALIVLLLGLLTLIEYGFSIDLGLDQIWIKTPIDPLGDAAPGRMAVHTAFSFFLLGTALLVLHHRRARALWAQILALMLFLIALLCLLGYLFGNAVFYRIGSPTSMAVHTSIAFLLLSLGLLLARPQHGIAFFFVRRDAGGLLARRLIPCAIVLPPLVCWLLLLGARAHIYTFELGICLLSLLLAVLFTVIIGIYAEALSRLDQQKEQTQALLQQSNQELEIRVDERTRLLQQTNAQLQRQVGERRQIEQELREAHVQLESALVAGAVYTWRWNIPVDRVVVSAAFAHLFGVDPSIATTEGLPLAVFVNSIHADDRAHVAVAIEQAIQTGEPYATEYRVQTVMGGERWLTARGQVEYDDADRPVAFPGALADLTERKRVEEERDRFFQLSHDMLAIVSMEGYFLQANPAWTATLGYTIEELTAQPYIELVHPDDRAATVAEAETIAQGVPTVEFENRYRCRDGSYRWISWSVVPFIQQKLLYCVARDVTERKQAEAERDRLLISEQAARKQAEAANRIKDEFLAVLSHELRTPLNPILGWSKLLQSHNLDEARTAYALQTIERNACLQSQLIEDLLDVSRILRGKLTLTVTAVELEPTIKAAIETVRLAAEAKHITLESTFDPKVKPVSGDAGRLQQVVWNLLSNAIKFTPSGGQVEIQLTQSDHDAQIKVSDTGKGIALTFLPYVFEHFRQEDSATTRKFGGLGLGLAIVHQIVELHGGTVAVESSGEGQGATFTVCLPLRQSPASASVTTATKSDAQTTLNGLRVLVVDDETDARELVQFILEEAGANVTGAASVLEALQVLRQAPIDVLISDLGMPDLDGYKLMEQIRSEKIGQTPPPAIALTAYAGDLDQQKARESGFNQYLSKPLAPEALLTAVIALVRGL